MIERPYVLRSPSIAEISGKLDSRRLKPPLRRLLKLSIGFLGARALVPSNSQPFPQLSRPSNQSGPRVCGGRCDSRLWVSGFGYLLPRSNEVNCSRSGRD